MLNVAKAAEAEGALLVADLGLPQAGRRGVAGEVGVDEAEAVVLRAPGVRPVCRPRKVGNL